MRVSLLTGGETSHVQLHSAHILQAGVSFLWSKDSYTKMIAYACGTPNTHFFEIHENKVHVWEGFTWLLNLFSPHWEAAILPCWMLASFQLQVDHTRSFPTFIKQCLPETQTSLSFSESLTIWPFSTLQIPFSALLPNRLKFQHIPLFHVYMIRASSHAIPLEWCLLF